MEAEELIDKLEKALDARYAEAKQKLASLRGCARSLLLGSENGNTAPRRRQRLTKGKETLTDRIIGVIDDRPKSIEEIAEIVQVPIKSVRNCLYSRSAKKRGGFEPIRKSGSDTVMFVRK